MAMTREQASAYADALLEAERARRQIGLLSLSHPGMTLDDAYAIQTEQIARKLEQGHRIVGWKIGLTSRAMQDALGIDTPDSGVIYDNMMFDCGDVVPRDRFIQPRVEAEIAFVLRHDIYGDATRECVLAATEYVVPALEVLDTRIYRVDPSTGQPRTIVDTVADNASNAGVVLGKERHAPTDVDLRWVGAIVRKNQEVVATGLGAAVLDDPATGVVWLARRMATYGQHLAAGQIVLSGSFIAPIECPPGTEIEADFGTFGRVELRFE